MPIKRKSSNRFSLPSCATYIRLTALDSNWNLLTDIAVTNFALEDSKLPARPSLTLWKNRIYVCYDQWENATPGQTPENADSQVYIKVYQVNQNP